MAYNEYKANTGKVLLNLSNFTYGNTILSKSDLSSVLIELDKSIAEEYINKYREQIDNYNKEQENKQQDVESQISTMSLDANGVYSETEEIDNIDNIRIIFTAEILTKYNTSKNITCIKHE